MRCEDPIANEFTAASHPESSVVPPEEGDEEDEEGSGSSSVGVEQLEALIADGRVPDVEQNDEEDEDGSPFVPAEQVEQEEDPDAVNELDKQTFKNGRYLIICTNKSGEPVAASTREAPELSSKKREKINNGQTIRITEVKMVGDTQRG